MTRILTIAKAARDYDPLLPALEAVARDPARFLLWLLPLAVLLVGLVEVPH